MPKCVKCKDFFPPNYVDLIEGAEPMFDGELPKECIFCKLQVNEVERETEHNSGKFIIYTKEQCLTDYKKFLRKLKDSRNVKDILNKTEGIIKI